MAKFDLEDKKALKKVAKELQVIVNPSDQKTGDPIDVAKGSVKKIIEKVKAVGACLTTADEISKDLKACMKALKIEIAEAPDSSSDETAGGSGDLPTPEEIGKMKKDECKALIKKYKKDWAKGIKVSGLKIGELRDAILEKLPSISAGGSGDLPDADEVGDMDWDELEELCKGNEIFSDIDPDDFDEDEDDEMEDFRNKVIAAIADATGVDSDDSDDSDDEDTSAGGSTPEVPEVDEDDPDETHEALVSICEKEGLDIDGDDFDEDDEDEVTDFRNKVVAALAEKYDSSDEDTPAGGSVDIPSVDEDADWDDLDELVTEHDLDIDPDDFDEDEDDEVEDLREKVVAALAAKYGGSGDEAGDDEPTLADEVNENKDDFKALKKMVKGNGVFAKLNDKKKLKKFKDSPEKLAKKMIKAIEKGGTAGSGSSKKSDAPKSDKKDKGGKAKEKGGKGKAKKPGVIATIIAAIEEKPVTHKQILENLIVAFPEKDETSMAKTIKVQVPNRIRKEKNSTITEKDGKFFFKKAENGIKKTPK